MKKKLTTLVLFFMMSYAFSQQNFLTSSNIEQELRNYRTDLLDRGKEKFALGIGATIDLGDKRNGSMRAYATVAYLKAIVSEGNYAALGGVQSLIEFYRGGLGTSVLNSKKSKINIELRNSFLVLTGWDTRKRVAGKPAFVSLGSNRSPLIDPLDYSVSIGTMFVNGINHKRHQRVGTISISPVRHFRFAYFNDNLKPGFNLGFLGDTFDRYWSGGGSFGIYRKDNQALLTELIIGFDNYTGYQANLYETVDFLKLDNVSYKNQNQQMYNQSKVMYQFGFKNATIAHWSIYQPHYWDIQKWIHYAVSHNPFHPRPQPKHRTFGVDYNYINNKL